LKKGGFKASFISGLFIYTCGILTFWPCAVLASYPAFIVSNFIVGLGMATIEIALNPFVTLCGPPEDAEIRLNIVRGFEAVGRAIPPIFSHRLLSAQVTRNPLIPAQWSYLGIALLCSFSILGVYYSPIATATYVSPI
jgi:fucose permease